MKSAAKRIIDRTAHIRPAWFVYSACGRFGHYFDQIYGHARWVRENTQRDQTLAKIADDLFPTSTVSAGPFQGMRYPHLQSVGSALLPKLLGSYESELHPVLEELLTRQFNTVVDIGCAEGYYAVGLGLRLNRAEIFAFDTNERARQACEEMARLNGIGSRVHVGGLCDKNVLRSLPLESSSLIVADCEGYERQLFDSGMAQFLASHSLIIEAHDFIDIDISASLKDALSQTHWVQSIKSVDDIQKAHTYTYKQIEKYNTKEKYLILSERRPSIMEWIIATPFHEPQKRC